MNPLLIILIVCRFLTSVQTFGVEFDCPDKFHNGPNTVTCKINRTAIQEAKCLSISQSVTFDRTVNSQTTVVCMYNYDQVQPCIPETQHTPGKCWCSQASGEAITYYFSYIANSTLDEGGQLECKLCMLPDNPLDVQVSKGCRHMTFASLQESQMTDSTEPEAGEEKSDVLPLAVGIGVGAPIFTVILIVVVVFCKKRHLHHSFLREKRNHKNSARYSKEPKQKRISTIEDQEYDGFIYKPTNQANGTATHSGLLHDNNED